MRQDTLGRFVAYDLVNGTMLGVLALGDTETSTTHGVGSDQRDLMGMSAGYTWAGGWGCVAVAVPTNGQVSRFEEMG